MNRQYIAFILVGLIAVLAIFSVVFPFDFSREEKQHDIVNLQTSVKAAETPVVVERSELLSPENDAVNDKEIPTTTDTTEVQFLGALESARPWLEGRGYFFMENFVQMEDRGDPDLVSNDYNGYSLKQLKELALNQDPKGQMYYGLSLLHGDLNEAEKWLKESIVSGNYTSTITRIMDAYQVKINAAQQRLANIRPNTSLQQEPENSLDKTSEQTTLENEILVMQGRLHAWGITSKELNDPFSYSDLFDIYDGAKHSRELIEQSKHNARMLVKELRGKRRDLGLPEFNQDLIDEKDFSTLINYMGE